MIQKRGRGKKLVLQRTPQLEKGINLLKSDDSPIQRIVSEELKYGGEALWIDAGNESSTYELADQGAEELLERVKVARAFTPFQHHTASHRIEQLINTETELVVLSNVDMLYVDGQLSTEEAEELFSESMGETVSVAEENGLKVLLTAFSEELEFKMRVVADNVIESKETREGKSFRSSGFRTQVFGKSGEAQTRLNFWTEEVKNSGEDERNVQKPSRQHS